MLNYEKDCNCFNDKKAKIPTNNYRKCMKLKNKSEKCQNYNKCKSKFSNFMSGYEPDYEPKKRNDPIIENSHNCYAYFLDDHIPQ